MTRERLIPDKGVRGWLKRIAVSNYWRVSGFYELDDLVSDGYLCYYEVRLRYPNATARQHIMRLFQVTYLNHIHDLAKKRTLTLSKLERVAQEHQVRGECAEDDIGLCLAHAPSLIRQVLKSLDAGLFDVKGSPNAYLCRLVGVDPQQVDLVTIIKNHLKGITI